MQMKYLQASNKGTLQGQCALCACALITYILFFINVESCTHLMEHIHAVYQTSYSFHLVENDLKSSAF